MIKYVKGTGNKEYCLKQQKLPLHTSKNGKKPKEQTNKQKQKQPRPPPKKN